MTSLQVNVDNPPWLKATTEEKRTIQTIPDAKQGEGMASGGLSGLFRFYAEADGVPPYWSQSRDEWLRDFLYKPNNDLLLGTTSTIAARVATSKWFLEGPERTVNIYQKILLQRIGFNAGWSTDVMRGAIDFLTQDKGWTEERLRASKSDRTGGAIGFAHMDSAHIDVWTDPDYPVQWRDEGTRYQNGSDQFKGLMHRSRVFRIVDMPSPSRDLRGVGLCALSRALTTARILADIARYERERLSDLPPAGILLLNNMTRTQWDDVSKQYDTRQQQQGNQVWRDTMVAFGLNPAVPLQAELLEFSTMPEHFDKKTITEIAIYSFALAFNTDPREIWPVSSGTLGTATEANIQNMKAKAKGHGLILALIERALNDGLSLPPTITFKFDYQDVEEDERAARIRLLNAKFISILAGGGAMDGAGRAPIINIQQAQQWLIKQGYFDQQELEEFAMPEEDYQAEDTEVAKALHDERLRVDHGPLVRMWCDPTIPDPQARVTRVERLEKRPMRWNGWRGKSVGILSKPQLTPETIEQALRRYVRE